jgi:hypothetical protein
MLMQSDQLLAALKQPGPVSPADPSHGTNTYPPSHVAHPSPMEPPNPPFYPSHGYGAAPPYGGPPANYYPPSQAAMSNPANPVSVPALPPNILQLLQANQPPQGQMQSGALNNYSTQGYTSPPPSNPLSPSRQNAQPVAPAYQQLMNLLVSSRETVQAWTKHKGLVPNTTNWVLEMINVFGVAI